MLVGTSNRLVSLELRAFVGAVSRSVARTEGFASWTRLAAGRARMANVKAASANFDSAINSVVSFPSTLVACMLLAISFQVLAAGHRFLLGAILDVMSNLVAGLASSLSFLSLLQRSLGFLRAQDWVPIPTECDIRRCIVCKNDRQVIRLKLALRAFAETVLRRNVVWTSALLI